MYKHAKNPPDIITSLVIVKTHNGWVFFKKIKTHCGLRVGLVI